MSRPCRPRATPLQMCTDGSSCKRRVCFFAHTEGELRKPEEDPLWLQQQLQAELAAGAAAVCMGAGRLEQWWAKAALAATSCRVIGPSALHLSGGCGAGCRQDEPDAVNRHTGVAGRIWRGKARQERSAAVRELCN